MKNAHGGSRTPTEVPQACSIARVLPLLGALLSVLMLAACAADKEPGGPQGTQDLVVDLKDLQPSLGALSPSFNPATDTYNVQVSPTTTEISITATVADTRASLKINGQPAASGQPFGPLPIQPGTNPPIPLVVEALGFQKQYSVVVERTTTAHLQSLVASAGPLSPAFDPETLAYTVTTDTNTASTTITATLVDPTATLTINNQGAVSGQPSQSITLPFGPTQIPVRVLTLDGKSKNYVVTVNRPFPDCSTSLTTLTVNQGSLSPGFNPDTTSYAVPVGSGIGSLTVTATAGSNATVKINGQTTTSAQVALNPAGQSTTITITVDCPGQPTKTYTIRVDREAPCNSTLTNLTVNQGQLSPAFNPTQTSYQVNVSDTVGQLTVTATPTAGTTGSINGQVTNTLAVNLNPAGQSTTITIVVQCPDGSTRTYTIVVNRSFPNCSTNLTNLTVNGTQVTGFNPNTTSYTVNVAPTTGSVTIGATAGANATVSINGQTTTSLNVTLNPPGQNTSIQVQVTCQGQPVKTYTISVVRPASPVNLANLQANLLYNGGCVVSISPLTLTPNPFSANTTSYSVNVAAAVGSICVTATKGDPGQTVTIAGQVTTQRIVTLNAAGTATVINVVVTGADGVTTRTYTLTVNRAAPSTNNFLSALELRENGAAAPVTLFPVFSGRTDFNYSAEDCCGTISYRLTATAEDSTATLRYRVNTGAFQTLFSGVASSLITFSCCSVNTITVEVTAQNGQVRNYSISFQIVD